MRTATWEGADIFGNTNVPPSLIPGNAIFHFLNWKILGQIFPPRTEKCNMGFPGGASGKEPICQYWSRKRRDTGLIPGSGRSVGGEHTNLLQDSCLEVPWTEEPGGLSPWGSKDSATHTPQKCNIRLDLLKRRGDHTFISLESSSAAAAPAAAKSRQSCPTLCDLVDSSPPGSAAPGVLQARTLEWVALSFSNAWK